MDNGVLELVQLPPWEGREPLRPLYAAPEFFEWADATAFLVDEANKVGDRTPHEHMEQMFAEFRCSERPAGGDLHRVMPTKHGVWKMQPAKLRIYGWFHTPKQFVAISGATEPDTKAIKGLNDAKLREVLEFAKRHGLEGTILRGDHIAILHAQG